MIASVLVAWFFGAPALPHDRGLPERRLVEDRGGAAGVHELLEQVVSPPAVPGQSKQLVEADKLRHS